MRQAIDDALRRLERADGVRVVYAVESGSRAWGFASRDSDWDVRFVYVRRPNWYLSVQRRRDVLEYPIDDGLDVSGWDAANKLIILANSILRHPTTPRDVTVRGITGISHQALQAAAARGSVIKLVAAATLTPAGRYELVVEPRALPLEHPLAPLSGHQMGVWLQTDINGELFLSIREETPEPTAAAMLRDLVQVARGRAGATPRLNASRERLA